MDKLIQFSEVEKALSLYRSADPAQRQMLLALARSLLQFQETRPDSQA